LPVSIEITHKNGAQILRACQAQVLAYNTRSTSDSMQVSDSMVCGMNVTIGLSVTV